MSTTEHILVLGATGVSGLIFVRHVLTLPSSSRPNLTLYVRSKSKLSEEIQSAKFIRIIESSLDNPITLNEAMTGITAVVSFLGAYVSIPNIFLRRTGPTPIAEAMPVVCDAMHAQGVKRILVLSTLTAFPQPGELEKISWSWYMMAVMLPRFFVPQGCAEMEGIAKAVSGQERLDWTVFRVPHLNEGDEGLEVVAGTAGPEHRGSTELSRGSLARWLLREIGERKWVKGAPMLGNP